jgi:hypothetical protein
VATCSYVDGTFMDVSHSLVDEVNNCVYYTYNNHEQYRNKIVDNLMIRSLPDKKSQVVKAILNIIRKYEFKEHIRSIYGKAAEEIKFISEYDFKRIASFKFSGDNKKIAIKKINYLVCQLYSMIFNAREIFTKAGVLKIDLRYSAIMYMKDCEQGYYEYILNDLGEKLRACLNDGRYYLISDDFFYQKENLKRFIGVSIEGTFRNPDLTMHVRHEIETLMRQAVIGPMLMNQRFKSYDDIISHSKLWKSLYAMTCHKISNKYDLSNRIDRSFIRELRMADKYTSTKVI